MIVRILGEGQYRLGDEHRELVGRLDAELREAVRAKDGQAFAAALRRLLEAVRRLGTALPADTLAPSDLLLPDRATTLAQVLAILAGEGLVQR